MVAHLLETLFYLSTASILRIAMGLTLHPAF